MILSPYRFAARHNDYHRAAGRGAPGARGPGDRPSRARPARPLSKQTREVLTGIAGGDVALLVGNADGDPWTDLERVIPAPPAEVRAAPRAHLLSPR